MLRKLYVTLSFIIAGALAMAQTGVLKGKLVDKATNETIPFANIAVDLNGNIIAQGTSDIDGNYTIKPIPPGKYSVKATYVGYQNIEIRDVIISSDKTTYVDLKLTSGVQSLTEVEIVEYTEPLIDPDTKSGGTVTREEYQNMASKNINSVASTTAGVYQADEGGGLNIRGSRQNGTDFYIDGVRVIGGNSLPQQSIEQVTVITGGVPAQYGDATGGIIAVSTRGPQSDFFGSVQYETSNPGAIFEKRMKDGNYKHNDSKFLDAYGHNSFNFTVGGPIWSKRDTTGMKKTLVGYIVSGEVYKDRDPDPSAVGAYKIKDEKLRELEENPLRPAAGGGYIRNSEFLRMSDLEKIRSRQNVSNRGFRLSGKTDFKPTNNMTITLGGSADYSKSYGVDGGGSYVYEYSLFNPVNNPERTQTTKRAYVKLTQKFGNQNDDEKSTSLIKNAFYTVQAGYNNYTDLVQDDSHKDDLFRYGYIGKFNQHRSPTFAFGDGPSGPGYYQIGFADNLLTFTPGGANLTSENYTEQFYNFYGAANNNGTYSTGAYYYDYLTGDTVGVEAESIYSKTQIANGPLLNGVRPEDVYSTWYNTGRQYPGYNKEDRTQFSLNTAFSADIKDHAIQLGFQFEQRDDRFFSIAPVAMWGLMRQLANSHFQNFDPATAQYYGTDTAGFDYYTMSYLYTPGQEHSQFDKSLRQKLGLSITGSDYLDIDSYSPDMYSLDMFSAEELVNNGVVSYYGFDHTGKKTKGTSSFDDFFNKKDANGNLTKSINSFKPVYMAGYIQDKFDFRDLKINAGLRVDRYDANQQVLKDKYLLNPAKTAGEVTELEGQAVTHPSNIGSDYVVYVDNLNNPKAILGYRSGDTWYTADGVIATDPNVIATASGTGQIQPYLVNPGNKVLKADIFKDYEPQITVMPRIAFSFPISDEANFFAHYDVLTQRPPQNNRFDILQYERIQLSPSVNNPDLKPEKTIDYELGYSQILNERKNSALTLTAFYKELRDMLQVISVNYAYFQSQFNYTTLGNIDLGTVKGLTVAYDLRRTGPIQVNASYTLQFAEGTGSSATDNLNLINSGQPNLRTTIPLSYDQRHTIVTNLDYRFGSGKDYHGLTWTRRKGTDNEKAIQIFANMGANVTFRAGSGTPYTRQASATQEASFNQVQRPRLEGSINGSNLPWQVRMDLRIDKDIEVKWGRGDGEEKKKSFLNIYLVVLNALNSKNVMDVYRYTGNADDDGYLASAVAQSQIASQNDPQSFRELYSIKVNDPRNYSIPRRIHLGLTLNF